MPKGSWCSLLKLRLGHMAFLIKPSGMYTPSVFKGFGAESAQAIFRQTPPKIVGLANVAVDYCGFITPEQNTVAAHVHMSVVGSSRSNINKS